MHCGPWTLGSPIFGADNFGVDSPPHLGGTLHRTGKLTRVRLHYATKSARKWSFIQRDACASASPNLTTAETDSMRPTLPGLSGPFVVALLAMATSQGCLGSVPGPDQNGGGGNSIGDAGVQDGGFQGSASTFEALPPATYVSKVKNLLIGMPATDQEIATVTANPSQLKPLIDTWMADPGFRLRMLDFFRNAFQQNHVDIASLQASIALNAQINGTYSPRLVRNIMDSFPLTVWELVQESLPLNQAVTTNRYMLTSALMSYLSYSDDSSVADTGRTTVHTLSNPLVPTSFTIDSASTDTLAQSLGSAHTLPDGGTSMTWRYPGVQPTDCTNTVQTYTGSQMFLNLFDYYFGEVVWMPCPTDSNNFQRITPEYVDSDWTDWRMVTINASPKLSDGGVGYAAPVFYDLLSIRAATTMSLTTARLGFFGTPAFDTNWGTNFTNEMRVTANQALIVAIGLSINGENSQAMFPVTATESDHASNPACTGCHSQLDPYKQFFRQSYTLTYHNQTDPTQIGQPAGFGIAGVTATGKGVGDIANILANHPRFALAWVLKLHSWANSTAAVEDDPEVLRIAAAFQASNFDFKTLVRELFSSPLVTFAAPTKTTDTQGVVMSIARRDQFCASLSNRLGITDICGATTVQPTAQQSAISGRAVMMPVDTYYRAYALPSLPTDPNLFYRSSVEVVCGLVANEVVDATPTPSRYSSKSPGPAIADFVTTVVGLPASDPRAAQTANILTENFNLAQDAGVSASDALKATFTLACIAPSSVMIGQ